MSWNEQERQQLLSEARKISLSLTGDAIMSLAVEELSDLYDREELLLTEYAENLPYSIVSRCPVCGKELSIAIDLYGIDGPWWWATCPLTLPDHIGCEHYRVFLGAMDFHGRIPVEATEGVIVGPAMPFVIDRLLEMESMKAVISVVRVSPGYSGFIISYFSEKSIDEIDLHQEWRRESYPLHDADGEIVGTESKFDRWNFEFGDWLSSGKVLWIEQGDPDMKLQNGPDCTYLGLKGTKEKQIVSSEHLSLWEAPYGQDSAKFEPA